MDIRSPLTCTLIGDMRQVGISIKGDGLVARVIAGHVALAAVDTHVLQNTHRGEHLSTPLLL